MPAGGEALQSGIAVQCKQTGAEHRTTLPAMQWARAQGSGCSQGVEDSPQKALLSGDQLCPLCAPQVWYHTWAGTRWLPKINQQSRPYSTKGFPWEGLRGIMARMAMKSLPSSVYTRWTEPHTGPRLKELVSWGPRHLFSPISLSVTSIKAKIIITPATCSGGWDSAHGRRSRFQIKLEGRGSGSREEV